MLLDIICRLCTYKIMYTHNYIHINIAYIHIIGILKYCSVRRCGLAGVGEIVEKYIIVLFQGCSSSWYSGNATAKSHSSKLAAQRFLHLILCPDQVIIPSVRHSIVMYPWNFSWLAELQNYYIPLAKGKGKLKITVMPYSISSGNRMCFSWLPMIQFPCPLFSVAHPVEFWT